MNAPGEIQGRLDSLRALVEEKFPARKVRPGRRRRVGCRAIDEQGGGLLTGAVTEVTGSSSGAQVLLAALLESAVREGFQVGLVDASRSFHPADWPVSQLNRILWVLCPDPKRAVQAVDFLIRDGNLPFLVLDLHGVRELGKVPASTWHRFHRLVEESETALVVLSSKPLVEGAATRIAVRRAGDLSARLRERSELVGQL
ncbi:MAG: hypothetical protein ACOYMS_13895, partial [Terrimicrobiaceae bacterium]